MIWLTFLPATLWPACGLLTVPLTFLISFLLLGEVGWGGAEWMGGAAVVRCAAQRSGGFASQPASCSA
jgi:hypothetical protein